MESEQAERLRARALIAEMLGGKVSVRQEGEAAFARLEVDAQVLVAANGNASKIKCFQFGSGGTLPSQSVDFEVKVA